MTQTKSYCPLFSLGLCFIGIQTVLVFLNNPLFLHFGALGFWVCVFALILNFREQEKEKKDKKNIGELK